MKTPAGLSERKKNIKVALNGELARINIHKDWKVYYILASLSQVVARSLTCIRPIISKVKKESDFQTNMGAKINSQDAEK